MRVCVLTTSYPRSPEDVAGRFVAEAVDHLTSDDRSIASGVIRRQSDVLVEEEAWPPSDWPPLPNFGQVCGQVWDRVWVITALHRPQARTAGLVPVTAGRANV